MRSITLFTYLLFSTLAFSQGYINYHNLCNEGAEQIERGEFLDAKYHLLKAIHSVDQPLAIDYFNLAKCYSQLYQPDSTIYYLELSLQEDWRAKDICSIHYLWFEPILGTKKWNEILEVDHYIEKKLTEKQQQLANEMQELLAIDQQYRKIKYDSIHVYHPYDTLLHAIYEDSIAMSDIIVKNRLEKIVIEQGWPGIRLTNIGTNSIFLIHAGDHWFHKMKDQLLIEVDKGNLEPWAYAEAADRYRLNQGESSLYDGYFSKNKEITPEIIENCKTIGAPLGKTRAIRAYYRMNPMY